MFVVMSLPGGLMWFSGRKGKAPMDAAPLGIEPL